MDGQDAQDFQFLIFDFRFMGRGPQIANQKSEI
jgi:hypothetical protein